MFVENSTNATKTSLLWFKTLINLSTLFGIIIAIIVSLFTILLVVVSYCRRRYNAQNSVSMLLTCNTCLTVFCSCLMLFYMNFASISGDWHLSSLYFFQQWCIGRGYLLFVFINAIYLSYCLQAFFRLCRIAFYKCKYLQMFRNYLLFILVQWSLSFLLILPMRIRRFIVYLPNEFYCQVPMTNLKAIVFSILGVYFIPLCLICIIYIWIIVYIRRQSIIHIRRQQNIRDSRILKRICFIISILLALGIPSIIFVILFTITVRLHSMAYRIGWFTISLSLVFIALSSVYLIPQVSMISLYNYLTAIITSISYGNSASQTSNASYMRITLRTLQRSSNSNIKSDSNHHTSEQL
ncbi:unnamed protein product [Didymodactylos carnosus]|uniref:G-protein coupled receptors family 1 profile domain-containing protein n=1 Tax=Didymodactylos carnosus TaxID=1234261 RepID=A0A814FIW6_9BILA|nr:unnamed protein product [Didymodactylos carnosus]CAF3753223.1 unnamed protein product [Didymodactylos carnosus]